LPERVACACCGCVESSKKGFWGRTERPTVVLGVACTCVRAMGGLERQRVRIGFFGGGDGVGVGGGK